MYCRRCGKALPPNARFCGNCSEPVPMVSGGQVTVPSDIPNMIPHTPVSAPSLYEYKLIQAQSQNLGMNWYKFIIYVQCFLGFITNVGMGARTMMGLQYGETAAQVYAYYPGLKAADMLSGAASIALGIAILTARFGLKKFKASAATLYTFIPLIALGTSLAYYLAVVAIVSPDAIIQNIVQVVSGMIGNVVLFAVNYIYFGNRKHLFNE